MAILTNENKLKIAFGLFCFLVVFAVFFITLSSAAPLLCMKNWSKIPPMKTICRLNGDLK